MINFNSYLLLESILSVDPYFYNIIMSMARDNYVASQLSKLFNRDINANLNYLKSSDKLNDEIFFINDSQVKRNLDQKIDPFTKANNSTKIGRAARQLIKDNGINASDSEIESFVNLYKERWDRMFKSSDVSIVSGEKIREWYLYSAYSSGGGELQKSCMRYEECQDYLDIYVENPDVCQMIIYLDEEDKLLSRALVWKIEGGQSGKCKYFLDRIYSRYQYDDAKIKNWFSNHFKCDDNFYSYENPGRDAIYVNLSKSKFKKYPYMDSFSLVAVNDNKLWLPQSNDEESLYYNCRSTSGDFSVMNYVYSSHTKEYIKISESALIGIGSLSGIYMPKSACVVDLYSKLWVLKEEAVYSENYQGYIYTPNCVDDPEFGIVLKRDIYLLCNDFKNGEPVVNKRVFFKKLDTDIYVIVKGLLSSDSENFVAGGGYIMFKNEIIYNLSKREWILRNNIGENQIYLYPLDRLECDHFGDYANIRQTSYGDVESFGVIDYIHGMSCTIPLFAYVSIGRSAYRLASEKMLKSYGYKKREPVCFITNSDYVDFFSYQIVRHSIKMVKNYREIIPYPEFMIEEMKKAHSILVRSSSTYRFNRDQYDIEYPEKSNQLNLF